MRTLILEWLVSACAFMATAYFMPGFVVKSFGSAFLAAVVVSIVTVVLRPILLFLGFPITILTFGLFLFVINGIVIKICASLTPGFEVNSWTAAILGAILLSLFNGIFHWLVGI